jgi:hypothetical protein
MNCMNTSMMGQRQADDNHAELESTDATIKGGA